MFRYQTAAVTIDLRRATDQCLTVFGYVENASRTRLFGNFKTFCR